MAAGPKGEKRPAVVPRAMSGERLSGTAPTPFVFLNQPRGDLNKIAARYLGSRLLGASRSYGRKQ